MKHRGKKWRLGKHAGDIWQRRCGNTHWELTKDMSMLGASQGRLEYGGAEKAVDLIIMHF